MDAFKTIMWSITVVALAVIVLMGYEKNLQAWEKAQKYATSQVIETGMVEMYWDGKCMVHERVVFKNIYEEPPLIFALENETHGTFVVIKAERVSTKEGFITGYLDPKFKIIKYRARIAYLVIGKGRSPEE